MKRKYRRRNPEGVREHFTHKLSADLGVFVVMYFLGPHLASALAPLQAQINASAAKAGATPATSGLNALANSLIAKLQTTQSPAATQA